MIRVKIKTEEGVEIPKYETTGSAGMDIRAFMNSPIIITPGERYLVPTGVSIKIPPGYEVQIRPRSGMALKKGVTVLNAPGTIDSDYTGKVGVILYNSGSYDFVVNSGDRIAQLILSEVPQIEWEEVNELEETDRGTNGLGSTGI